MFIELPTILWARHEAGTNWCAVLPIRLDERVARSSIWTFCRGRWPLTDEYKTMERPLVADRCVGCQSAYAAYQLDELVKQCGDLSRKHVIDRGLRELAYNSPLDE